MMQSYQFLSLKQVLTCSDSTNMSRHVILLIMRFDTILKHVQTYHNTYIMHMMQFDMILRHVQTFPDMSRHVLMLMMRFDTILKHVQTCHNAFDAI